MFVCICFVCVRLSGQPVSVHQFFLLLFSESIGSHWLFRGSELWLGSISPFALFLSLSHCLSFEWCRLGFMCVCVCCTVVAVVLPLYRVICLMLPKPLHLRSAIASHIKAACRTVCSVDAPSAWSVLSLIARLFIHSIHYLSVCVFCSLLVFISLFYLHHHHQLKTTHCTDYCTTEPHQLCKCECCLYSTVVLFSCAVCVEEEDATHYITSLLSLQAQVFCFFPHFSLISWDTTPALVGASHSAVFCFLIENCRFYFAFYPHTRTVLDFPQSFAVKRPSVTFYYYYCGGSVVDSRVYLCTRLVVCVWIFIALMCLVEK